MVAAEHEVGHVAIGSESLGVSIVFVFDDVESLVARNSVVQACGRNIHLQRPVRHDLWLLPTFLRRPVYRQHMICELLAEGQLVLEGFDQFKLSLLDFDVGCLEESQGLIEKVLTLKVPYLA